MTISVSNVGADILPFLLGLVFGAVLLYVAVALVDIVRVTWRVRRAARRKERPPR